MIKIDMKRSTLHSKALQNLIRMEPFFLIIFLAQACIEYNREHLKFTHSELTHGNPSGGSIL